MLRKDLRFRVRYVIALACTICFWLDTERGNFAFYIYAYRDWLDLLVWFFGFGFWLTMIRFLDFLMMFVSSDTYIYIYRYIYLNTS